MQTVSRDAVYIFVVLKGEEKIKEICILAVIIYASVIDIQKRRFPNICQVMLIAIYFINFNISNLWGVAVAVPFFIASCITGKMGMGDVKAVLLLGGLTGIQRMIPAVVIGCIIFITYGLIVGKEKDEKEYPFIPSLTMGYITEVLIFEIFRCI